MVVRDQRLADRALADMRRKVRKMKDDNAVRRERLKHSGWIGVDFDGTLAHYDKWVGWNVFGKPIPAMVRRVRQWLDEGREVRILTARVGVEPDDVCRCHVTGESYTNAQMASAVQDWTEKHLGERLTITCVKDAAMIELWDDRAVQVVANTGRSLAEEHEAEKAALRGKP